MERRDRGDQIRRVIRIIDAVFVHKAYTIQLYR